jgi:hypothetical protein
MENENMTPFLRNGLATLALFFTLGTTLARAEEAKVPVTVADHLAMSKRYADKATAWRTEAAYHRDMAAAYKKAHPDFKSGARNPWTVEMEKHCMTIVKDVEKAAADAEWAAKFHELRAKELEGK